MDYLATHLKQHSMSRSAILTQFILLTEDCNFGHNCASRFTTQNLQHWKHTTRQWQLICLLYSPIQFKLNGEEKCNTDMRKQKKTKLLMFVCQVACVLIYWACVSELYIFLFPSLSGCELMTLMRRDSNGGSKTAGSPVLLYWHGWPSLPSRCTQQIHTQSQITAGQRHANLTYR